MARSSGSATYRTVLAMREFRLLWLAEVSSVAGDQLGRIALSVLVFARTGSAALTGLTYGLTFVPTLLGSMFLAGLADHYRRRTVMIVCDVIRAVLIAAVVIPGLPLWALCVLVAVSTTWNGPYKAAQQALLPEVLHEPHYMLGMSLRQVSIQIAQLSGFALGGAVVAFLSPSGGLLVDAATFMVSAMFLIRVASRPVRPREGERSLSLRGLWRGVQAIPVDRRLLVVVGIGVLNLFHIVPEGLAAPYAGQLKLPGWSVALILASAPLGAAIGAVIFGRLIPARLQAGLLGPVAIAAGLALVPLFWPVGLAVSLVLFAVSGGLSGIYTMYSAGQAASLASAQQRARIAGVNTAVLHTANGLGPLLGGVVATLMGPAWAIAGLGGISVLVAAVFAGVWSSVRRDARAPLPSTP